MIINLTQVARIARREYLARVRNRAFIVTTIMVPAFMALYMFVMPIITSGTGAEELHLAVVDTGTGLSAPLVEHIGNIEQPRVVVTDQATIQDDSETSRAPFTAAVRDEQIDGYLLLRVDPTIVAPGRYYARETGNQTVLRELERAVEATVLDRLLADTGVDVAQVRSLQRADLATVTVSADGESEGGFRAALFSTLVLSMLLYMAVLINGQGMALAIVEEKASRLIEVILGAVTATEFMTGKIVGVLGSGLTQLAVWVAAALVGLLYALPMLSMSVDLAGIDLAAILNMRLIFYFSVFFTLGYCLYSIVFATIAATYTSTEEFGQSMFAAILPMVLAFMSTIYVIGNPSTTATRVLSLLPPFTPLVMLARVNVLPPPLWEVSLGIGLLVLGIAVSGWLSAKVFRYALLMHGKRPTLPDLLGVMRAT